MKYSSYVELITKYHNDVSVNHELRKVVYGKVDMFLNLTGYRRFYHWVMNIIFMISEFIIEVILIKYHSLKIILDDTKVNKIVSLIYILSKTYIKDMVKL